MKTAGVYELLGQPSYIISFDIAPARSLRLKTISWESSGDIFIISSSYRKYFRDHSNFV